LTINARCSDLILYVRGEETKETIYNTFAYVKFEVLKMVSVAVAIFWDVKSCYLLKRTGIPKEVATPIFLASCTQFGDRSFFSETSAHIYKVT
jgi:hypothetical protein